MALAQSMALPPPKATIRSGWNSRTLAAPAAAGAKEIADAARNGDAAALRVWREFGEDLAELLSQWIARWDLEKVALGGQIAKAWALFRAPLETLPVFPAKLPEAALYGAFMKAREFSSNQN